jgi:hypothetical protein
MTTISTISQFLFNSVSYRAEVVYQICAIILRSTAHFLYYLYYFYISGKTEQQQADSER